MKSIIKYMLIWVTSDKHNDDINVKLSFGRIIGPYYSQEYPQEQYETEIEAIEAAYQIDKYTRFMVLPIYSFNHFD